MRSKVVLTLCLFIAFLLAANVGRCQVTLTISVTPSDTICAGQTPHFHTTPSVPGPYGHIWMVNTTNTGVTTPFYNPATLTNHDTVWCVLTNVAGDTVLDTSNYIVMTVIPAVVPSLIAGPDSVCLGSSIMVMDSVAGGTWHSSNTAILTVDTAGLITPVAPGQARVVYMITTGSCVDSVRFRVRVQIPAGPITGPNVICLDSVFFLRDTSRGGIWQVADTNVATLLAPFGVFQAQLVGTTKVYYNIANACGTYSDSMAISVINCDTVTGISFTATTAPSVNIFPNPSAGTFSVIYSGNGGDNAIITLSDLTGTKISQIALAPGKTHNWTVDIAPGLYFITSRIGTQVNTQKLVISRQ